MKTKIIGVILTFFIIVCTGLVILSLKLTPVTLKRKTFVYEYGEPISTNPVDYVNANDQVIGDVVLNLANVKKEIGVYKASVSYAGTELPFYIKVQDTTKPVVKLKQVVFNVDVNEKVYALDLIDEVKDHSDIIAYFLVGDEHVSYIRFNEKGSYVENIVVEDAAGNQTAKLRVKIVVGVLGKYPTLEGINNIEIVKGSKFDALEGVSASDGNGNDITSQIKILKNNVDVDDTGTYEVIYSITNSDGKNLQRTRRVDVIKHEGAKTHS